MKKFVLYGRDECHLCETMRGELLALQSEFEFEIEWVDVDADPALEQKYGFFVPVLMYEGQKLCHYHFDKEVFLKFVQ